MIFNKSKLHMTLLDSLSYKRTYIFVIFLIYDNFMIVHENFNTILKNLEKNKQHLNFYLMKIYYLV